MNTSYCLFHCSDHTRMIAKDVYQCQECLHIFRDYKGDGSEFHNNPAYRTKNPPKPSEVRKSHAINTLSIIQKYLNVDDTDEIYDIGCGAGDFTLELMRFYPNNNVYGVEIDPGMYGVCIDKGINAIYADAKQVNVMLSLEDRFKSIAFFMDVLEHIRDPYIISNYAQVCKQIVIQVPTNRKITSPNPNFDGHYHYFTRASLEMLAYTTNMGIVALWKNDKNITSSGENILCIMQPI